MTSFSDPKAAAFREEIRTWLAGALPTDWRERENDLTEDAVVEIRREWDRKLHAAGYAGLAWPAQYGGREVGPILETIFHEEMATAHAPEGLGRIGRVMVGPMIIEAGTAWQRERFLPRILDGSEIWCLGYSEPHAGSDLAAITTTALREGSTYRIRGRKIWTSHAHRADRCMLLCRSSLERPRYKNVSILLVDVRQPGVTITPIITAAGDHHFNEVTFDDAIATEEERLGAEHEGWQVFRSSLKHERGASIALNYYHEMRREMDVLDGCCALHAPDPAVRSTARALGARVELVRWHIMRATELEAAGMPARSAQVVLKLYWSELWQELTTFGQKIACDRHRRFWGYHHMQARAASIFSGTSEIQRNMISRRLLAGAE